MAKKDSAKKDSAKKDSAKKAAAPATITLKHLAADIADSQDLSKKRAEAVLTDMVDLITKHLKKGDRVRIVGLGILQVRKRAARTGRNPATGEAIHIKASKKVTFRPVKELKEAI
ncbi:HU family DNA-binding protein [Bradyrhizobium betae]|uniref:HU family DNA-binding protein n=1 Tax=Bradyrhizobium betae TaxID=244734 RepID=A0A5P6PGI1_9BRAD|nr:HU family DNA-binding protein [Bradyrhizobium betae]MCS3730201.1 DNA-binding protein HU-beta [Bradyrhizobium betae]QFI76453.1 HU family DNA-binding protein [Bradyrhizobium betae]